MKVRASQEIQSQREETCHRSNGQQDFQGAIGHKYRLSRSNDLLLLQIVEVILDRPLIRAWHLFLAECALRFALRLGHRFGVSDLALAFDADPLERDDRHLTARTDLAFLL